MTPRRLARTPARMLPMGVVPANTVVYTLITRPRRSSGTVSWMMVLVVAPMATVDQPDDAHQQHAQRQHRRQADAGDRDTQERRSR